MNTSMSWIKAYVPELEATSQEYTDAMTLSGTKVEGFEVLDEDLEKIEKEKDGYWLINNEFISKLKDGACVINTARGGVANEEDIANALKAGKLSCYCADVLSTEPPKSDNPLLTAPNCFITPHIAWAAYETRLRLMGILEGNVKAFLQGNPINVVN